MRGTRQRLSGLAALAVLTAALAGCGSGSSDSSGKQKPAADAANKAADNTAVKQVMSDLQTASRAGDGKRICTQIFTPKLANSVTRVGQERKLRQGGEEEAVLAQGADRRAERRRAERGERDRGGQRGERQHLDGLPREAERSLAHPQRRARLSRRRAGPPGPATVPRLRA